MILDPSAVGAIFFNEPEADVFSEMIRDAPGCRMSVANFVELSTVLENRIGPAGGQKLDLFIRRARIVLEAVTVEQGYLARQAFLEFGKGRHPARLNFGDCFAYALARATGEPLLFKGNDFSQTDIAAAWIPES